MAVPVPHHVGPPPTVRGSRRLLPVGCLIIALMIIAWALFITGQTLFATALFVVIIVLAIMIIIYQSLTPEKKKDED